MIKLGCAVILGDRQHHGVAQWSEEVDSATGPAGDLYYSFPTTLYAARVARCGTLAVSLCTL